MSLYPAFPMRLTFHNRIALVTGAAHRVGRAIALSFITMVLGVVASKVLRSAATASIFAAAAM